MGRRLGRQSGDGGAVVGTGRRGTRLATRIESALPASPLINSSQRIGDG